MNSKQIKLLSQIKRLVRLGNRRFANERRDRDYLDDLKKLRITEDEAWEKYILYLKPSAYVIDYKPSYYSTPNTLVFKKLIKDTNNHVCINKCKSSSTHLVDFFIHKFTKLHTF